MTPSEPIIVHHLDNSRSHRIIWLLEELQLNFIIKEYKRGEDMQAPKALEKVHPLGKSPVITDGQHTIAESGAIIEYLVEKYGPRGLKPLAEDSEQRLQYNFWMHYAEGSLMPQLLLKLVFNTIVTKTPFIIRPIARGISKSVSISFIMPNLKKHFEFVEEHLEKNKFFGGENFNAADIQMSIPILDGVLLVPEFIGPKTKEWLKEMEEREAYKMAIEKGGKYDF